MTTSVDDILETYLQRKAAAGPLMEVMRSVRDTYNGDVVVPLPEREGYEKVAVANLLQMGLDQMGDRVASTVPDTRFAPRRGGKAEETRVRDKRKAVRGWWDHSRMGLKLYRRGRHLLGYGTTPVLIRPDFANGAPVWELKDPLATYAPIPADPDDPCVPDAIFAVKRSLAWLRKRYDVDRLMKPTGAGGDERFEVLEYVDCDELVVCVIGRDENETPWGSTTSTGAKVLELERLPNRAGVCTAVVPGRINLDRRKGQFEGMIGMYQAQARLFALEVIAVEQGVFPDEWLVARQGEIPDVVRVADGRRGIVGMVKGGDLRQQSLQPGQMTYPTIDRLERSQRLTGGIPAEFGGESQTNVRTGRRGENILSATIDFTLLQAQRVLATSMEAENSRAIAVDKGYHDTSKSFYVAWHRDGTSPDYTPSELFDTDQNFVTYAQAGTDINGLVVSGGQRVGMGTLSREGFMEMDPLIEDPEVELDRITSEKLLDAMASAILQQAGTGAIPPNDVARIAQLVKSDRMELADAILKAQTEAQERQAEQVPAEAPEAQPGLSMPGMGAESATIPENPMPSVDNLAQLLGSLRRPQALTSPGEAPRPEAMVG